MVKQNSNLTRKAIKKWTIRAGNWGQGLFSFTFSDTNLANFEETFFLINDKAMRWIAIPILLAFFMPRYSAIHDWDTVVFFHSKPARSTFHGSVSYARPIASRTRRSFSRPATPAKPTRTLALPCPPQDWFSRLQRTKYEQLMPDLFDVYL